VETERCYFKDIAFIKTLTKHDHLGPIPVGIEMLVSDPPFISLHTTFNAHKQAIQICPAFCLFPSYLLHLIRGFRPLNWQNPPTCFISQILLYKIIIWPPRRRLIYFSIFSETARRIFNKKTQLIDNFRTVAILQAERLTYFSDKIICNLNKLFKSTDK